MLTTLWNSSQPALQWAVPAVAVLVGAATDLHARRLPNWLTAGTFATGLAFAAWSGGVAGVADGLLACVALGLPYVLLFLFAGGGAGDAKLMGALGVWLGVINGGIVLGAVAVSGILLGIGYAIATGKTREVAGNISGMVVGWAGHAVARTVPAAAEAEAGVEPGREEPQTVPYGVAICAGLLVAGIGVFLWRG
ncbi:MAG TPA: A24 family peptidase [Phycisphaerales bacterium]|nr:A24 family peptidase [Phycisphaerales bacterium]